VQGYDWNWEEAERQYRRAVEDGPGNAMAHASYGIYLSLMGRSKAAIAELGRARQLDPLSVEVNYLLALAFVLDHQYDAGIAQHREALRLDPAAYFPARGIAYAYQAKRDIPQAITWMKRAREIEDNPALLANLSSLYALAGNQVEARRLLRELKQRASKEHVSAVVIGLSEFYLGDKYDAFAAFEKAFAERSEDLVDMKVAPWFDPLRSDPRFQEILRRMNFPK
jgi:tetratricopeptide (TPR) repeat protein